MKWVLCALLVCQSLVAREPIVDYQVLFSPRDHLAEELISMIEKERKSVKIAVYSLTHRGVVKALSEAQKRGVAIEVIVDPYSLRSKSVLKQIGSSSFPLYVWSPADQFRQLKNGRKLKKKKALMHDKFCVLGEDRVWTGSFNFTLDANSVHQENALVVENRDVASSYLAEFERLKKDGCVPFEEYIAKGK